MAGPLKPQRARSIFPKPQFHPVGGPTNGGPQKGKTRVVIVPRKSVIAPTTPIKGLPEKKATHEPTHGITQKISIGGQKVGVVPSAVDTQLLWGNSHNHVTNGKPRKKRGA